MPSVVAQRLTLYFRLARLHRPIGILLLLWPTLWGLWLSAAGPPPWHILLIFVLGTVLTRSAGCVINDYADRDFDPYVARTRDRPLATRLVSPAETLILAGVIALCAFSLTLFLNRLTIALAVVAAALAASYPFTKRFFWLPQAYLGVAFGFGIPMAFAAVNNEVPALAWWLLLANVFWAIAYDTEYAMVDREDDRKIGIRTAAILFGRHDVLAVMFCQAVFLGLMAWIGWRENLAWPYYAGLATAAALAARQFGMIRRREPGGCLRAFLHNNWVGVAIFVGLVVSLVAQTPSTVPS